MRSIPDCWDWHLLLPSHAVRTMTVIVMLPVERRQRFVRLLHRELQLDAFFDAVDRTLATIVPFDSSCWLSLDPATLLPTSHFTRQLDADHLMELAANEYLEEDVNKFADLALADRPAATLRAATSGDPGRSARYVRVLAPHGYQDGDELRATFMDGEAVWGCVALHRRTGVFEDREARLVADVGAYVAAGIRRAILRTALVADTEPDPPGLILLRADDTIESVTPAARPLLAGLFDSTTETAAVPLTVTSLAHDARRAGAGETEIVASVRLPKRSGGWLRLRCLAPRRGGIRARRGDRQSCPRSRRSPASSSRRTGCRRESAT